MANPWFPSGSAPVFIPPLATACDSQDPVPSLPPEPPDPPNPFPLSSYPPLSSSSPSSARSLPNTTSSTSPVVLVPTLSHSSTVGEALVPSPPSLTPQTRSITTVQNCRSETTVASTHVADNYVVLQPRLSSPIQTNKATTPNPNLNPPSLPSPKPNHPSLPVPSLLGPNPPSLNHSLPEAPSTLVEKLRKAHDKTLSRLAPVSLTDSGRPRILIPDSVFQKGAEKHKDFITCQFNGRPPPFSQIQSVLNHMWEKVKRLRFTITPSHAQCW